MRCWPLVALAAARSAGGLALSRRRAAFVAVAALGGAPAPARSAEGEGDAARLARGLRDLDALVGDWKGGTTDCRYADVNRRLLAADAKADLLREATTNALMNKSGASVTVSCRRDPEAARLVFGLDSKRRTQTGPLLGRAPGAAAAPVPDALRGADRAIARARRTLVDADDLGAFVAAEEAWLEAVAALDGATYASGASDIGALGVASAGEGAAGGAALLDGTARDSAVNARDALRTVVSLLPAT